MSTDSRVRNCGSKLQEARLDIRKSFLTTRLVKGWNREVRGPHYERLLNIRYTNIYQKWSKYSQSAFRKDVGLDVGRNLKNSSSLIFFDTVLCSLCVVSLSRNTESLNRPRKRHLSSSYPKE